MFYLYSTPVCPDDVVIRRPCIYQSEKSRAFKRTETQTWQRKGCKCEKLPINVTSELCGCRRQVWAQEKCSSKPEDKGAILLIKSIREQLVQTLRGPKCKLDIKLKKQQIG